VKYPNSPEFFGPTALRTRENSCRDFRESNGTPEFESGGIDWEHSSNPKQNALNLNFEGFRIAGQNSASEKGHFLKN
jgi:hypothetical protein